MFVSLHQPETKTKFLGALFCQKEKKSGCLLLVSKIATKTKKQAKFF
jgi:hypothetical protein